MVIVPPPPIPTAIEPVPVTVVVHMRYPDKTPATGWRAVADRIEWPGWPTPRKRWYMPAAGVKGKTKFTVRAGTRLQIGTATESPPVCTSLARCCPVWRAPVTVTAPVTLTYTVGQAKYANCQAGLP